MKTSTSIPTSSTLLNSAQFAPPRPQNALRAGLLGFATAASVAVGSAFGAKAAEEPAHQVVIKDGDFQVREYDAYAVAETVVSPPFDAATRVGFGRLVRYISGANNSDQKIEMTAPVEMKPRGEKIKMTAPVVLSPAGYSGASDGPKLTGAAIETWTMAFVLPEGYTADTAPRPANPTIRIRDVAPGRVATVRFNGFLRQRNAEQQRKRLEAWLTEGGLEHEDDWRTVGYNPPWTIPQLRRNEVLVTLP